jgi:hypothetical protein
MTYRRCFESVMSILTAVLTLVSSVRAGVNINVQAVSKAVVFLYGPDTSGKVTVPLGTGFLAEVPLASDPTRAFFFLITARHIVDPQWAHCAEGNPTRIYARFNKKNFDAAKDAVGTGDLPLDLVQDGKPTWNANSDDEVDAAVFFLNAKALADYDYVAVPVSVFPTPEEVKSLATGDNIISAGLIPGASGKKRNYPVFKFGNISSIPDEPADVSCQQGTSRSEKVWFIAASLVPGNSGSPIFYFPFGSGGISLGSGRPLLLGVQSMSFLPWDVAGMTPVQYVYEIIQQMKIPNADLRRGPPPTPTPRRSEYP